MRALMAFGLMLMLGMAPLPAFAGQTFIQNEIPVGEHSFSIVKRIANNGRVSFRATSDGRAAAIGRGRTAEAAVIALHFALTRERKASGWERLGQLIHVTAKVKAVYLSRPGAMGLFLDVPGAGVKGVGYYPDTLFMPEAEKLEVGDTVTLVAVPATDGEDIVISVEKVE